MKLFSGFANFNSTRKEKNIPSPPPTSFDSKRERKSGTKIFTSVWSSPVFWKAHNRRKQTDICERLESGRRNRQASPRAVRRLAHPPAWRMKLLPEGAGEGPWLQREGRPRGRGSEPRFPISSLWEWESVLSQKFPPGQIFGCLENTRKMKPEKGVRLCTGLEKAPRTQWRLLGIGENTGTQGRRLGDKCWWWSWCCCWRWRWRW